jgi:cell division protein FtsN
VAPVETYQVIVVADSAETQDKVRSVAPNAFLTSINGQVVMQVGIFRDRREADRLQQRLSMEGLPTAVIPVR